MQIALTGTPGTGKTTVAALLRYRVLDINSLVRGGMNLGQDPERGCLEADMDALAGHLDSLESEETVILEGHFSHHFADWAIVLRLSPAALRLRLEKRREISLVCSLFVTVKLPPSVKTRWDMFHYAENQNGGMHGTTNQLAAAYR